MNYVIQNYQFNRQLNYLTPRTNGVICFNNISLIFFFHKIYFTFNFLKTSQAYFSNLRLKIFQYAYNKYFLNKIRKMRWDFTGFYTNNLTKSLIFWNAKLIFNWICNKARNHRLHFKNLVFSYYTYNQYLIPTPTASIRINNNKFKNCFFFNFFLLSFLWYQQNTKLKFQQNFLHLNQQWFILPVVGGYFFKIYKY